MVSMQQVSTLFHLHILSLTLKYLILEDSESLYCVCLSVCPSVCHTCVQWCQQSGQATNAMFSPTYFVHLQSLIYFIAY